MDNSVVINLPIIRFANFIVIYFTILLLHMLSKLEQVNPISFGVSYDHFHKKSKMSNSG